MYYICIFILGEKIVREKFLKDLGIDIDGDTEKLLQQFDLNGFMDQIADNRIKEEDEIIKDLQEKDKKEN